MTEHWAKVIDPVDNKTVLGLVGMPNEIAAILDRRGGYRVMGRSDMLTAQWFMAAENSLPIDMTESSFTLQMARSRLENGVYVFGIALEALSNEPGYAFLPTAEYIRRTMLPSPDPARGISFQVGTLSDQFARVVEEAGLCP